MQALAAAPRARALLQGAAPLAAAAATPGARALHSAAHLRTKAESSDVTIVGGGIMGLHTAYQLSRRVPGIRVTVLEKGTGLGEGSSGYSSALLRCGYSLDHMMKTAIDGLVIHKNWSEYLEIESPLAKYHNIPILWIVGKSREQTMVDFERHKKFGMRATVMTADDIRKRWPAVNPCNRIYDNQGNEDHECGHSEHADEAFLAEEDTGYFEPNQALEDLASACRRNGVKVVKNARVTGVLVDDSKSVSRKVTGVVTKDGTVYPSGSVVNSSGPWCNQINQMAGVKLPFTLKPVRIQVIYKQAPQLVFDKHALIPGICDTRGGIYLRPQIASGQILASTVKSEEEDEEVPNPDQYNTSADPEYRQRFLNSLLHRIPALEPRGALRSFSAMYTMCKEDVHPLIGPTELKNYYVANGFSGHGYKISPAVGSLLAQSITGTTAKFDCDVPISFFSPYREPHRLPTLNVLA